MGIMKLVREGETVPRGYGIARWNGLMQWAEAYPVPLNLLVRAATWAWRRIKIPRWGQKLVDRMTAWPGIVVTWDGRNVATARVLLDGTDISKRVRRVSLQLEVGEPPSLELEFVAPVRMMTSLVPADMPEEAADG